MMMHMPPMHRPLSPYSTYNSVTSLGSGCSDRLWITDETIAAASTTDDRIPATVISSLKASYSNESLRPKSPNQRDQTFLIPHRSPDDSAYGSPENTFHNPGNVSPTNRSSPFQSPKNVNDPKRTPPKVFHLPLDSPRGSVSGSRVQQLALPRSQHDLKTHSSEGTLAEAYTQNDSAYPHFQGPSSVRHPSFPKNRASRGDSLSQSYTETCCATNHHAGLERKMSALEKRIEGLIPALQSLTKALDGLAASFETGVAARHMSIQTAKAPEASSRQHSGSSLAEKSGPLNGIFDVNPFDRRPLGSVAESQAPSNRHGSIKSIQSRLDHNGDTDDENNRMLVDAWRHRPRQQSCWDPETESETDESEDSIPSVPPMPVRALSSPIVVSTLKTSTAPTPTVKLATTPNHAYKKPDMSIATAVMRSPVGKKPAVIMRLNQHRPSIALPPMRPTDQADVPPLPTFSTASHKSAMLAAQAMQARQMLPRSAPPDLPTFSHDRLMIEDTHLSQNNSTLTVASAMSTPQFPVKPFSVPPSPSTTFQHTFPDISPFATPQRRASPHPQSRNASISKHSPSLAPSPALRTSSFSTPQIPPTIPMPAPRPAWYFFYGPLIDPALLVELLHLPSLPSLHPARVHGRVLKFFGPFPVAISHRVPVTSAVEGRAWYVPSAQMAAWLRAHEEEQFVEVGAEIEFLEPLQSDEGGERPEGLVLGRMFEWSGEVGTLMDGPSI